MADRRGIARIMIGRGALSMATTFVWDKGSTGHADHHAGRDRPRRAAGAAQGRRRPHRAGLGAIRREPAVLSDGGITPGERVTLSLTVDHVVLDGVPATALTPPADALLVTP